LILIVPRLSSLTGNIDGQNQIAIRFTRESRLENAGNWEYHRFDGFVQNQILVFLGF